MRFATFQMDGHRHIGIADDDGRLVEVTDIVGSDMGRLISQAEHMMPQLSTAASGMQFPVYAENDVRWLPPLPAPGKICVIAMNSLASDTRTVRATDHPTFFLKPSSCLVGHRQPVRLRNYYGSVHPEPGLAVVIGKQARDVNAADAHAYIFGFTMFNDITGSAMCREDRVRYVSPEADEDGEPQRREHSVADAGRCKGSDTFGCMGPWIVTADEVENPDDLDIFCSVNGEAVAEGNTRNYRFKVSEIVSFVSQFQTLEPGDVIGCGAAIRLDADRQRLEQANLQRAEGPVEMRIEGLDVLSNPVIADDRAIGAWRLANA